MGTVIKGSMIQWLIVAAAKTIFVNVPIYGVGLSKRPLYCFTFH